ncbi:MAG: hypothetical protein V9H69_25140 [Anaerolineae bacterium]
MVGSAGCKWVKAMQASPAWSLDLFGDYAQKRGQLAQQQVQRLGQPQRLDVVQRIHAGRAQVNDAAAHRALLGEGADLSHQVVADLGLDLRGPLQVDLLLMRREIGHLLGRHQPGLLLRRGQCDPKAPQQQPLVPLRPNPAHRLRAITPSEGREIGVVGV